jgi:hypothetical protein
MPPKIIRFPVLQPIAGWNGKLPLLFSIFFLIMDIDLALSPTNLFFNKGDKEQYLRPLPVHNIILII